MFKTLARQALIPVGLAVTGFFVVCCLLLYSAIKSRITRDAIFNATSMADTVLKSTRYAMLKDDRETLAMIIRNIGEQKGVDHVRIFNKKGVVNFSARSEELNRQLDKKAEGCIACHSGPTPSTTLGTMQQARSFTNSKGKKVLAITAPIYNEPECFNAACHAHPEGQKVLGTLDIGLTQEGLLELLATIRIQMIVFTILTLILTVGGVTALLRRSVFIPMQRLREFVEESMAAENLPEFPPHLPQDLDRIAHCYHDLLLKYRTGERNPPDPRESASEQ